MMIAGFQPFTLSDFPGRAAAILFTQGCNFRCPYCHNKQLLPLYPQKAPSVPEDAILDYLAKRKQQLEGVVITGGEPTMHEDLAALLVQLKSMGFLTKVDTNGSRPGILKKLIETGCVDYIAMDIKAPLEKYSLLAGCDVVTKDILTSIGHIQDSTIEHHFRTTHYTTFLTKEDLEHIRKMIPHSNHVTQQCLTMVRTSFTTI
jgi:pyruvate formate lyase activating enzyme